MSIAARLAQLEQQFEQFVAKFFARLEGHTGATLGGAAQGPDLDPRAPAEKNAFHNFKKDPP